MIEDRDGRGLSGQQLASYRLEAVIGCGAFGCVYRARHVGLDTVRAVKVVRPDVADTPHFRERFAQDMKTAVNLSHPNIVPVADFGVEHDVPYVVMALVESRSLAERLHELPVPRRTTDPTLQQWIRDVAAALDHAHAFGVVHSDLKPSHVLVAAADERALLTDFAIARALGDRGIAQLDVPTSARPYMAPEQLEPDGALTTLSDVYAFAAILHEIATGSPPDGREQPPERVAAVVARGLARAPEERYSTAGELAAAFLDAATVREDAGAPVEEVSEAEPPEPVVPAWAVPMRLEYEAWPPPAPPEAPAAARYRLGPGRWLVVAVLGAFVAVGFGALAALGLGSSGEPAPTPGQGTPAATTRAATPSPAAAPAPPGGLPLPISGTVGRPIDLPGARLTVVRVDTAAPIPARLAARAGDSRFIAIEVRYENTGDRTVIVSPFDWDLTDGAGGTFQAVERQASGDLTQQELAPGRSARGVIGFLVPRSSRRLVLSFTAELGDSVVVVPVG